MSHYPPGDDVALIRSGYIDDKSVDRAEPGAYASPYMPELVSSLSITGVDGTLRRSRTTARGSSHLKSGTLANVVGVAGYVLAASGKRYALVMIVNHANAVAARPAIDALLDWTMKDN